MTNSSLSQKHKVDLTFKKYINILKYKNHKAILIDTVKY